MVPPHESERMDKHQRGPIACFSQHHRPMAIHFWICLYPHHSPIFTTLVFIPTLSFPQFTHSSPILTTLQSQTMAANTLMSSAITAFPSLLSSSKSRFASAVPISSFATNASSRFSMTADWMPGQPRPPYLDGSAPGYASESLLLFSPIILTLNMFYVLKDVILLLELYFYSETLDQHGSVSQSLEKIVLHF